ncbi:MAG: hypothetical protein AAF772_07450 [Acidobacteriota bacterium]
MHRMTCLAALLLLLTLLAAPAAAAPSTLDAPRVTDWLGSWWQSVIAWVMPEPPPVDEQGIIIIIDGSTAPPSPPIDEQGIIIIIEG